MYIHQGRKGAGSYQPLPCRGRIRMACAVPASIKRQSMWFRQAQFIYSHLRIILQRAAHVRSLHQLLNGAGHVACQSQTSRAVREHIFSSYFRRFRECWLIASTIRIFNTRTGGGLRITPTGGGGAYNAPPSISAMRANATNFGGYLGPYYNFF